MSQVAGFSEYDLVICLIALCPQDGIADVTLNCLFRRSVEHALSPWCDSNLGEHHVNSEPVSTKASSGGVDNSSRLGLQAMTLTLNTLTGPLNTGSRDRAR
jgi:hypothetical protein